MWLRAPALRIRELGGRVGEERVERVLAECVDESRAQRRRERERQAEVRVAVWKRNDLGGQCRLDPEVVQHRRKRPARLELAARRSERVEDVRDQLRARRRRGVESPRAGVGLLEHEHAAGCKQTDIGRELLVPASERRKEKSVRARDRSGRAAARSRTRRPRRAARAGRAPPRQLEHRRLHVGARRLPTRFVENPEPAERPAAEIDCATARAGTELLEQAAAGRFPHFRLHAQALDLGGLPARR